MPIPHAHAHAHAQVGRKPSSASAYLGDHADVVELLRMLASLSNTKRKAHASAGDLTKVGLSLHHTFSFSPTLAVTLALSLSLTPTRTPAYAQILTPNPTLTLHMRRP